MSVNSVNQYTYVMTLADLLYQSKTGETDELAEKYGLSSSTGQSAATGLGRTSYANLGSYGAIQSADGVEAIKKAVSELEADGNGRITFKMIQEYCSELEQNFEKGMRAAVSLAGVPDEVEFKLVANSKGEVEVQCDDPAAKAVIEEVLKEIPALEDEFKYIQALKNADKAQSSATASQHRLSLQATRAGLQQQAMEQFLTDIFSSGEIGYSSLLADFGAEGTDYFVGANYFV
ncbi:MAG: hypothetical protein LBM64_00870 [Deltaproteobacteria bacterium]|jgi:hypothetical protein|nr:hypothetical protein [Deltaproteobacteria bacterium]